YNSTYSFEDEDIGTSGTDIDFVDSTMLYDGACEIVSDWQGHKKVLRLQDDVTVAEDPQIYHSITQATSGTHEFWIGTTDVTKSYKFSYEEIGGNNIIALLIQSSKLYWIDDGDVWNIIVIPMLNDILYHIKVVWRVDNTMDLYVNGDLLVDNQPTNNNMVGGIERLYIRAQGDSTEYLYLDAYDESSSPGYSNGRNRLTENDDLLGHYPASHSFPFDDVGEAPEGWDSAAYTVIGSAWQEHRKVLKLTRDGSNPIIERDFYTDITSGTIELYMGSDDVTQLSHLRLYDGASSVIQINLYDDKLQYRYDGAYNPILDPILDNKWYHIKLDFETGAGLYKGLAADTFYITIDGTQYGPYPFNNVAPHVDKIYFTCNSGAVYNYYVDAIDYSWDPYYSVGRNINPTVANMLGQYPATYSFESDLVQTSGTVSGIIGISDYIDHAVLSGGAYSTVSIAQEIDGHRKVLELTNYGTADKYVTVYNYFENQMNPTFEFWWGVSSIVGKVSYIGFYDGVNQLVQLGVIDNDDLEYDDGVAWQEIKANVFAAGVLVHVKLVINLNTSSFDCYVNGELGVVGIPLLNDFVDGVDSMYVLTHPGDRDYSVYLDAVGNSFDDNYLLGDDYHYNNFLGSETFENYNQTYPGNYYGTESFDYYTEDEVYYGTYDFRDEVGETDYNNIDFIDYALVEGACTLEVIAAETDHKYVLELDSTPPADRVYIRNDYSDLESGTIEFWSKESGFNRNSAYHGGIQVWNINMQDYSVANTWNHWRLTFESGAGGYDGLVADTYNLYMNGAIQVAGGAFANPIDHIDIIYWGAALSDAATLIHFDAIGYSWDTTSHGGLGYTVDYNILSQDIEPILQGGYEIDNIQIGDSLEGLVRSSTIWALIWLNQSERIKKELYDWDVAFDDDAGDIALMTANGSSLVTSSVIVT
ncbi:hypothetical protein LCGC14_1768510, partial [marine sediment metagenome]